MGEACRGLGAADIRGDSMGVQSRLGDSTSTSVVMIYAGLCGNGDNSMTSIAGAGDEEGSGGVVITLSVDGPGLVCCLAVNESQIEALTLSISLSEHAGREQRPSWRSQLRTVGDHDVSIIPRTQFGGADRPLIDMEVLRQICRQTGCGR